MNRLLAVIAALIVTIPAQGQSAGANAGEIHGRAVNAANGSPVPTTTVSVTLAGSTVVGGRGTANASGDFRVQRLRTGVYRVQVRALGYKPVDIASVSITVSAPVASVGTISLTAVPRELESVAVTEERANVQLAPDRNSYVVRDMPATRGGNALDVLRNVPAVDVDIDNVVSLRGNSGVTIQINGRPSPLKPAQLGNFLSQLPADMVDKVEVVPNPSARDDPTGVAGIINIILKQETDAGTSGGLTVTGGSTGQVSVGANYGAQHKALTFYGSYGFLHDRRPRTESLYRENTYLSPITYLIESVLRNQERYSHTFTGSGGYKLGAHDDLSLDLLFSTRREDETFAIAYNDLDFARVLSGVSTRESDGTNHQANVEAALGYKHGFAAKGHKLTSELRIVRQSEGGPSTIASDTLSLTGNTLGSTDRENLYGYEHPNEYSLKADYTRPLASGVRFESGYKGSLQRFHTTQDTRVLNSALAVYLPDSTRISDFTYDQQVNAAYGMLGAQRGKFQMQGGVRLEHATTKFHLFTLGATFDNGYNSVFPSALVAYNLDETRQAKVSYSTRIRRPDDTDVLDPTLHFADPLNVSRGNPYLRPEYIRAFELGLQQTGKRLTIQLTPFWRHSIDAVRSLRTIDSLGVTTRTFANIASTDSYGGDATFALSGSRLSGFAGASAYEQVSDAGSALPGLSVRTFSWRARTNAALRISSTRDIQALFSYQAPMNVEQGHTSARTQFSIAGRQKLMEDQVNLTLRVIDPFNTSHESSTTLDPRFYQTSDRARAIRGVLLSVSWTFGKPEKKGRDTIDLSGDGTTP